MVISIVRHGGFTNIQRTTSVDTRELPRDRAKLIQDELTKLSNDRDSAQSEGFDRFTYSINYKDDKGDHSIKSTERKAMPLLTACSGKSF